MAGLLACGLTMAPLSPTARLLRDLIAVPSVNPAFAAPEESTAGEARIARVVAEFSRRAGLDVELQEALPGRPNVIARLGGARSGPRVVLGPHLDTVGAIDPAVPIFEPRVRGDRLYGRGACDTKGSAAAMLVALAGLARGPGRPRRTEIVFCGFVDEENAQGGSRFAVEQGLRADLAIVGEPTRLRVVTAHKGDVWLELETRGKPAHGATPERGRNAVHAMARAVDQLETKYARALRRRRHPLLGHATVNVGTIRGGTQPNIVPARCVISVDRRTLPGETDARVRAEIRALLRRHRIQARLLDLRAAPCLPLETDPELPLVRALMNAARQRGPAGVHFFCDAAVLAAGGIPSVVFGPGDIAQAHTADEWISLASLDRATEILSRFLRALP